MDRKTPHPQHAPDEPTGDQLPVEPEMQKGVLPEPSGKPDSESSTAA
ncbi:MAG TPA: hypothetical protein VM183_10890 [Burkholderiales bacterium]|nr:hypothetical protein [Burkholderiales bacterium]